jgi:hypothetical protein
VLDQIIAACHRYFTAITAVFGTGSSVVRVLSEEGVKWERRRLMIAKEAARYLRASMFTLSKLEGEGGLLPYRTPGGHRRYSLRMLNEYLNNSSTRFLGKSVSDDSG